MVYTPKSSKISLKFQREIRQKTTKKGVFIKNISKGYQKGIKSISILYQKVIKTASNAPQLKITSNWISATFFKLTINPT
jgi:hypothetical protein